MWTSMVLPNKDSGLQPCHIVTLANKRRLQPASQSNSGVSITSAVESNMVDHDSADDTLEYSFDIDDVTDSGGV